MAATSCRSPSPWPRSRIRSRPRPSRLAGGNRIGAAFAWLAGGLIFLLGFVGEVRSGLNGDSAWLLHVAGRVLDGSRLYSDVVEVNPPLVVWLNLPVVVAARVTGLSEATVYRGLVWGIALLGLLLVRRTLAGLGPALQAGRRRALVLAMLVVLVGLPGAYFGQREHLALILLLPWLVLVGTRLEGAAASRWVAVTGGVLAALGVGLKPHLLLVPLAVTVYAWLTVPKDARRVPSDLLAMGSVLAAYGAAVVLLAPGYLGLMHRLGAVYWDYLRRPLATILAGDLRPLTILWALGFWPVARRLTEYTRLADVLGLATAGFMAAVVLQHKGFGYHYYPALATGFLLVVLGLLGGGTRLPAIPFRLAARGIAILMLLPALALFVGWAVSRAAGDARLGPVAEGPREIGAFLDTRRPSGAIVIWSPWMDDSFPLVLEHRVNWASRYPFVWFMPALYRRELAGTDPVTCHRETAMPAAESELVGTVAEDLRKWRPELIFVRKRGTDGLLRMPILACFAQVPEFRREFGAYRPLVDLEHFRVYQRIT